jgi:hypothetical protein
MLYWIVLLYPQGFYLQYRLLLYLKLHIFLTKSYWLYYTLYIAHQIPCPSTTLVVIGTDCTGSCKSNYHTITTTTVSDIRIRSFGTKNNNTTQKLIVSKEYKDMVDWLIDFWFLFAIQIIIIFKIAHFLDQKLLIILYSIYCTSNSMSFHNFSGDRHW